MAAEYLGTLVGHFLRFSAILMVLYLRDDLLLQAKVRQIGPMTNKLELRDV